MNLVTFLTLGLGVAACAAVAAWYFLREASATDLGSISRNWMAEHRNDRE